MPRRRSCCVVSEPVLSPVASFFIHTDSMFQSLSVLEIRVSGQEGKGDCNRVACITLKIKARWWEWDAKAILTMQSKNCSFTNTYMRDHFSHILDKSLVDSEASSLLVKAIGLLFPQYFIHMLSSGGKSTDSYLKERESIVSIETTHSAYWKTLVYINLPLCMIINEYVKKNSEIFVILS